ncbi:hypothetical protein DEU56DRAFT_863854 [Suillus clintonianus]|uniref:uncharacterized protein n=1 Tax=Suillus clintonianus TaxID=1904413 RepID=UPI001B8795DE|nr:uncharacterized protein DEU56DRAFT_863854 [Suillus clintonianus]KAG2123567.1 hypothetical protein DEU56DRAFT_863854 [Suillus clintonianus]
MLYDPTTATHLKPWLVRTLEPICDAEPGALSEYILALLKHNVPENEMRKELSSQLEEFLEKEGPSFIDTLFTVLRTKSYLPYTAGDPTSSFSLPSHPLSADTGIPIPLDALLSNHSPTDRGQKRSLEHDERDGRPPTKGARLSAEGQFSRYSNGRDSRSTGAWSGGQNRAGGQGMMMNGTVGSGLNGGNQNVNTRRPQNYQPPDQRKGICRDYHNNGYCARGALCKYSHGDDAFVPSQMFSMNGAVPFLPMFGGIPFGMGQGAPYDPHEARMDMRPNGAGIGMGRGTQRAPLLPRNPQEDGSQVPHAADRSGELPVIQDLTPQPPPDSVPPTALAGDRIPQSSTPMQQQPIQPMDVEMGVPSVPGPSTYNTRGGFGGGMRGAPRGRGVFGGDAQTFRPERRQDKTLVVEKIPEDKLSLDAVNGWFKRFGTVTNVAIDARSAKALVSFSEHTEAHAAWKSEDAVFGNRFVKVFWHRPMDGHGQTGSRMLAASAPLLANLAARDTPMPSAPSQPPVPPAATPVRKQPLPSTAVSELAAKQKLLEQQIAEQKSLMTSLETASAEEKKGILARLRKLGEEMTIVSVPPPSATIAKVHSPAPVLTTENDHEKKERERLDKELELHAVGESTEDLKAKLAKLREEAASLGIPETNAEVSYGAPYRGYRGRGRGARGAFFRGAPRGGPPRASMKLDNRPRKLLVKGVREDSLQALRDWYETTGQLESTEIIGDDEVLVSFKTRAAAEQGFAKGPTVAAVGPVKISWHSAQQSQTKPQGVTAPPLQSAPTKDVHPDDTRSTSPPPGRRPSPRPQEEEVIASGWGDGDEDGMGMF